MTRFRQTQSRSRMGQLAAGILAGVVLAVGGPALAADFDFSSLIARVPADANTLVLIDAEGVLNSPIAQREGWRKKQTDAYLAQTIFLPPSARFLVLAAELDLQDNLRPVWELGLINLTGTPDLISIARAQQGSLETVAGKQVVLTGRGRYIARLGDHDVAAYSPANRQSFARWLRSAEKSGSLRLSEYLQLATAHIRTDAQIVLAMDLADTIDPAAAAETLPELEIVQKREANVEQIAAILGELQGVTLSIEFGDKPVGTLRVSSRKDLSGLGSIARPLLLEVLSKLGAGVEDFSDWKVTMGSTSFSLKGELSEPGMRRIFSILEVPRGDFSGESTASESDEMSVKAATSKKYFEALRKLMDDLQKTLKDTRDNHAVWMERYARKIDDLPILNVDEDLLTYAGNVSNSFRYQALTRRRAGITMGTRAKQTGYSTRYAYARNPYTGYGRYAYSTTKDQPDRTKIRREEMAKASEVRFSEWKQIEDGMVALRRTLTERYQIEF